jgi:hypothetical protein
MKKKLLTSILSLSLLGLGTAQAILIFNMDNLANTTDPGTVPWDAAARVANYDGSTVTAVGGTAVHLGDGYMLTANHNPNRTHVSFDGSTWLEVDGTYAPQQVAPNVDLKIFKLASIPTTSAVILHDNSGGELNTSGTIVAWGRGREFDTQLGDDIQDFGKDPTIDKRWGTNTIREVANESWDASAVTYTQEAMTAVLGDSEGDNEFAFAIHDSGSPYFQVIGGTMVLTGIAASRTAQNGTTGDFKGTFGNDSLFPLLPSGDENLFVQVGAYADEIAGIVPEPSWSGLGFGLAAMGLVAARRAR